MNTVTYGCGDEADPWILKTPSLSSEYQAWQDKTLNPPALVVQVGTTRLSYQLRCIEDLRSMLKARGDCSRKDRPRFGKESLRSVNSPSAFVWLKPLVANVPPPRITSEAVGSALLTTKVPAATRVLPA